MQTDGNAEKTQTHLRQRACRHDAVPEPGQRRSRFHGQREKSRTHRGAGVGVATCKAAPNDRVAFLVFEGRSKNSRNQNDRVAIGTVVLGAAIVSEALGRGVLCDQPIPRRDRRNLARGSGDPKVSGRSAVKFVATVPGPTGIWVAFGAEFIIAFVLMTVLIASNRLNLAKWTGVLPACCWCSSSPSRLPTPA